VSEEQVIVAGEPVIVAQRGSAFSIVGLEQLDPHEHAADAGRHVVGRTAHETEMEFRPSLECSASFDQLSMAIWKLPPPVDASSGVGARECQGVDHAGPRLEVVKGGHRPDRIAKCLVSGHVGDACAINIDVAPVAQASNMILPCLYRNHFPSISRFLSWRAAAHFEESS